VGPGAQAVSGTATPSPLQAALGYRKFQSGVSPRVLVMHADYHVVADVLDGAHDLGWTVASLPTAKVGRGNANFLAQLLQTLVEFRPDFLLSVNHLGFDEEGALAELLERFEVPLASWFVDHPLPILGGAEENARSNCQVFCFERTALSWLTSIGFDDPRHLPTGSNAGRFHPRHARAQLNERFGHPLCLVAGSWWHKARVEPSAPARAAALALAAGRRVNREFVRDGLEQTLEAAGQGSGRDGWHGAQAALAEASMNTRRDFIRSLLDLEPVVHGDQYWRELVPEVRLEGPVDPRLELPTLFASCNVNLNVTAEQMPTAVNQRVWDVPGAGGLLLTDAQEDVLAHFTDGRDVVTYQSNEEAHDKARHYLAHPDEGRRVARAAFEKVEREHRVTHRLLTLESVMRRRFG
jgi:spore maturation protein CgeB